MQRVWELWGGVLIGWAILAPVAGGIGWGVFQWRTRRGVARERARRWGWAEVGIVVGTLPWVWMILTPLDGGERGVNWVPLVDLAQTVSEGSFNSFVQVSANLAVFVPLGLLLPLRFPWFSGVGRMFATGAALSLGLEIAQYALDLGRYSSVDDVLMNAAGAGIGAALARLHESRRVAGRSYSTRVMLRMGWATGGSNAG
ncbi:VanZ family protein [Nocardia sp. NPDC057668]|uniref:VanZ family protein n=1 Tax=Nocardia sp. NPDC057668 TaxID=3346202 RepID=UPI00366E6618